MKLKPTHDTVIVTDMNFDQRITSGGIILLSDDKRQEGIRPRWARVIAIGPEQKDVKVGDWILVAHGRWTRGIEWNDQVIRKVDNNDILLVSDKPMQDEGFGIVD